MLLRGPCENLVFFLHLFCTFLETINFQILKGKLSGECLDCKLNLNTMSELLMNILSQLVMNFLSLSLCRELRSPCGTFRYTALYLALVLTQLFDIAQLLLQVSIMRVSRVLEQIGASRSRHNNRSST